MILRLGDGCAEPVLARGKYNTGAICVHRWKPTCQMSSLRCWVLSAGSSHTAPITLWVYLCRWVLRRSSGAKRLGEVSCGVSRPAAGTQARGTDSSRDLAELSAYWPVFRDHSGEYGSRPVRMSICSVNTMSCGRALARAPGCGSAAMGNVDGGDARYSGRCAWKEKHVCLSVHTDNVRGPTCWQPLLCPCHPAHATMSWPCGIICLYVLCFCVVSTAVSSEEPRVRTNEVVVASPAPSSE